MKVSVIIPVFNSEMFIAKCLNNILQQHCSYFSFEVIVVNDGSNDQTLNVLLELQDRIMVINQKNKGPAAARNAGAIAADGDILVFTDADTLAQPFWLEYLCRPFIDPKIEACAGTYCLANQNNRLARVIQSEIEFRYESYKEFIRFAGTYNFAIRKDLYNQIGGFSEEFRQASGEDNDFCYKLLHRGYQIKFVPQAKVGHYHTESLVKYLREQYRHGFWRAKLYLKHPKRISGDDYTYWKDIFEPPLCFLSFLVLLKYICTSKSNSTTSRFFLTVPLIFLILLELFQASKLQLGKMEIFYAAKVFFMRAFARTAGFLHGTIKTTGGVIWKKKSA